MHSYLHKLLPFTIILLVAGGLNWYARPHAGFSKQVSTISFGKKVISQVAVERTRNVNTSDSFPITDPGDTSYYMVPETIPAWWHLGDTVQFRFSGNNIPPRLITLSGAITDVLGRHVAHVNTGLDELKSKGWTWKPSTPGYYEVKFSIVDNHGTHTVMKRDVALRNNKIATQVFPRDVQGFAVLPVSKPVAKVAGQFGFTYSNNPVELKLAKLLGFDIVRLLCDWGADFTNLNGGIESVRGQYNWGIFDKKVDLFADAGFVLNAQFCYTPLWASSFPEKTNINICVVEGTTYAPKDMADFSRFVETAVGRYKDRISLWEIWNEPSVPGGSIFWADTPENFVKLLEAGFKAVKKVQPNSQVWIGGLGPRAPYHDFYNKILRLGAGKYFEVLSLHGAWNTPAEKFRDIEKQNQVVAKPAVSGEWHAILQGNMQSEPILSEPALSFKMMKDLLYQVKQGISRTMLFEMINLSEKETLPAAIQNKIFTHSSGLFRKRPQIEPRHAAIVMANFLDVVGRKATYVKDFYLDRNAVSIELATANGPVVVFWSDSVPLTINALKPFLRNNALLRDWEGKPITMVAGNKLEPKSLYYLTNVNTGAIASAKNANHLISPRSMLAASSRSSKGVFYPGQLFDAVQLPSQVPASLWLQNDWKVTTIPGAQGEEGFSARAAIGAHRGGLDIVVEVTERSHIKNFTPQASKGDNLVIGIDCERSGKPGGNTELVSALTANGPVTWKVKAADPRGDLPSRWSSAIGKAKYVNQAITRKGNLTSYQLRIPWSELYPLVYDTTKSVRLSLLVNNSTEKGQAGFLEWGGGIAPIKDPSQYGSLYLKKQ